MAAQSSIFTSKSSHEDKSGNKGSNKDIFPEPDIQHFPSKQYLKKHSKNETKKHTEQSKTSVNSNKNVNSFKNRLSINEDSQSKVTFGKNSD